MQFNKHLVTIFSLTALLTTSIAGIYSCNKIDESIDEAVDEYLADFYSTGEGGLTIQFQGDKAVIADFGDSDLGTNSSVINEGDVYIKNITRTGPNKWSAEIIKGDYSLNYGGSTHKRLNSVTFEPTDLEVSGDNLSISNPDGWDISWKKSTKPNTNGNGNGNGNGSGAGDTLYNEVIEGDTYDEIIVRFNLSSGYSKLTVMTTETGAYERNSADMFVSKGSDPKITSKLPYTYTADCASIKPNRESEVCTFQNPGSGQWSVMLYGYNTYFWSRLIIIASK